MVDCPNARKTWKFGSRPKAKRSCRRHIQVCGARRGSGGDQEITATYRTRHLCITENSRCRADADHKNLRFHRPKPRRIDRRPLGLYQRTSVNVISHIRRDDWEEPAVVIRKISTTEAIRLAGLYSPKIVCSLAEAA